jgi:hypothetical protein
MNKITIAVDGTISIECETGTSVTRTQNEDGTTFRFMNETIDGTDVGFQWNGVNDKIGLIKAVREASVRGEECMGLGDAKVLVEESILSPQTFECGSLVLAERFIKKVNRFFGIARLAVNRP